MKLSSLRLRFTLRTLFVLVTVLCLWLGWNAGTVHHRRQLRAQMIARGWIFFGDSADANSAGTALPILTRMLPRSDVSPSWIRQMLGDSLVPWIGYPRGVPRSESKRDEDLLESAFPEAQFIETSPQREEIMDVPLR